MANIKHLVIVMMENHSFDEYFGTFPGVSGFFDQSPAFAQPWGTDANGSPLFLSPWRMSTFTSNASDTPMCQHQWFTMHQSVNPSSTYNQQDPNNPGPNNMLGFSFSQAQNASPPLMGYYLPDDIPYHWALASNFALCDNYFCSVLSGTDPNRLYLVGGTILPSDPSDPSQVASPPPGNVYTVTGSSEPPPVVGNPLTGAGPFDPQYDKASNAPNLITIQCDIPNYLAALQGVQTGDGSPAYRVYDDWNWSWGGAEGTPGNGGYGDLNVFECYVPFGSETVGGVQVGGTQLGSIGYPSPINSATDPNYFAANDNKALPPEIGPARDSRPLFAQHINPIPREGRTPPSVLAGVTWILPPWEYCEHPGNLSTQKSADGARYLSQIVDALIASPFWEETVLVVVYDETDAHFDHVRPPLPTPEQEPWIDVVPQSNPISPAPIGAGMRVPAIIVSPWTYGAGVIHDVMDHTSLLQLAETVTGVTCNALPPLPSGWRRSTFKNLGDVITNLGIGPVQGETIQTDRSFPTGLPTSAAAEQWQTNAQARYNVQTGNPPQVPAPPVWPAVPQACAFVNVQSYTRAEIGSLTTPMTFTNAVTIAVTGFEPQEFIDCNAGLPGPVPYPGMLQPVPAPTSGAPPWITRIPSVIAVGRPDILFACTGVSSDPNQLAAMALMSNQQGVPSNLIFTFSVTFQNPANTFAGIGPAIFMYWLDLQAWFTVDTTVIADAQLYLVLRSFPPWIFTKITEFGNILGSGGGIVIDVQPGNPVSVLQRFSVGLRRDLIHIINQIDLDASESVKRFEVLVRDAFDRHRPRKTKG